MKNLDEKEINNNYNYNYKMIKHISMNKDQTNKEPKINNEIKKNNKLKNLNNKTFMKDKYNLIITNNNMKPDLYHKGKNSVLNVIKNNLNKRQKNINVISRNKFSSLSSIPNINDNKNIMNNNIRNKYIKLGSNISNVNKKNNRNYIQNNSHYYEKVMMTHLNFVPSPIIRETVLNNDRMNKSLKNYIPPNFNS